MAGGGWLLFVVGVLDALLGMALGFLLSAFARTEFQAVQFMPAVVFPQLLLCGLLTPRHSMDAALRAKLLAANAAMYQPTDVTPKKVLRASPKVKKNAL